MKAEATCQTVGFRRRKGVVQNRWGMDVEIVNDQVNAVGGREMVVGQVLEKVGKIGFGAARRDAELTPTGAWLHGDKQVCHAVSHVFVVDPFGCAGSHQLWLTGIAQQLARSFIDAHHGLLCIERLGYKSSTASI